MELLLVGIGGACGSITRFALGRFISAHSKTSFPRGTFVINITGAIMLGILVSFQYSTNNVYLFLGDGFLGAYTTFSTFMYEGFNLFQDKEKLNGLKYVFGTISLGILGFVAGIEIGKILNFI